MGLKFRDPHRPRLNPRYSSYLFRQNATKWLMHLIPRMVNKN